jgi:hypothetical protein
MQVLTGDVDGGPSLLLHLRDLNTSSQALNARKSVPKSISQSNVNLSNFAEFVKSTQKMSETIWRAKI